MCVYVLNFYDYSKKCSEFWCDDVIDDFISNSSHEMLQNHL